MKEIKNKHIEKRTTIIRSAIVTTESVGTLTENTAAVTKTGVTQKNEKGLSMVFMEKFSHLSSKSYSKLESADDEDDEGEVVPC